MANIEEVFETEALFMDALGGEFVSSCDPKGGVHTLGRLVGNTVKGHDEPIEYPEDGLRVSRELSWAPGQATVSCVLFELGGGFSRYGEERTVLKVPVGLDFSLNFESGTHRRIIVELFHPVLFSLSVQPLGPEKGVKEGTGWIWLSSIAYGTGISGLEEESEKVGLTTAKNLHRARQAVTELAEKAFNHAEPF